MSQKIENIKISIDDDLEESLKEILTRLVPNWNEYRILRKSIDARRAHSPYFIYSLEVAQKGEKLETHTFPIEKVTYNGKEKPIIIGAGPAGLFAALRLVERGIHCQIFERGPQTETRIKDINRFWRYGEFNENSNVCFGEGGAGLYSDGKLITRIKSPSISYVMNRLVQFGAPEEIQYLSNPHIGSDRMRRVLPVLREYLQKNGCEIYFNTKIKNLLVEKNIIKGIVTEKNEKVYSSFVVLATGHSASDVFDFLYSQEVFMEPKSFAVGLRVEHPRSFINQIQYREFADHPKLEAANYRLAHHDHKTGVGVYSFCMCPGGYVLSCPSESNAVVCNGMSNFHRNSPFSNSAIVVSIDHKKMFSKNPFDGLIFRKELEIKAKDQVLKSGGSKELPAQKLIDFLSQRSGDLIKNSSPSGAIPTRLDTLLPKSIYDSLTEGFQQFHKEMNGFISHDALLFGIESRTSCPIRVTRNSDTLESVSHQGLYPCGEGAGYSGGITSSACDGIQIAEKIVSILSHQSLSKIY